ncbi:dynamin family protein, partial [Bacteroides thetaiotaomicron]|nr:dynamin family protein [Bacteroides thetaiotaomicron]
FEAAYWDSEEEKQAVINAQVEFAENEMGRRNFQLMENIYSLNLGKVADAASYQRMEHLQEEAAKFQRFEK